ncbi:MAG: hypothetical protein V2J20_01790 [Wenzhouxiangella sp.]|jgi:hypothetical protein|nr:hypothetical protein [Wenzhouxiangella sp.]
MHGNSADLDVIIPAGPGEQSWRSLVDLLPSRWPVLITAVDDAPLHLPPNVDWLQGPAGRGRQLNLAAASASGRWMWFLHADSQPSSGAIEAVEELARSNQEVLAYFDLGFLSDGPRATSLNALGANLRSRWLKMPYGDQGLCLAKHWFDKLEGFRTDLRRGEDLDLVIRAQAAGLRLQRLDGRIWTSARRYREHGWLATTWQHQVNAWRLTRAAKASIRASKQA